MTHGGARPGAGRIPTSIRVLDIGDTGVEFAEPVEYSTDNIEIHKCSACGAHWWSDFTVTVTPMQPAIEPDEYGRLYPPLAEVAIAGKPEKHLKGCPAN